MKSLKRGKYISKVDILNISKHGIWISIEQKEYLLGYKQFPWFKNATITQIMDVTLLHGHHLHWEQLDVDLELESLKSLNSYPLIYQASA